jgi:hypothetical protein
MHLTDPPIAQPTDAVLMPPTIRRAVISSIAVLLTMAGYLLTVRGSALLIDLSQMAANMFCF